MTCEDLYKIYQKNEWLDLTIDVINEREDDNDDVFVNTNLLDANINDDRRSSKDKDDYIKQLEYQLEQLKNKDPLVIFQEKMKTVKKFKIQRLISNQEKEVDFDDFLDNLLLISK